MRSFTPLAPQGQSPGASPPATAGPLQAAPLDPEADLRLTVLVRTIEHEIIPRLMLAHRSSVECVALPGDPRDTVTAEDIDRFARLVLSPDEQLAPVWVQSMLSRGIAAETICTELLAPVARRLGTLWEQDLCDFTDVTLGLGRLHQVLRELGPSFEQPADSPANGRRVLLLPSPGEHHTFGLVMVSEFFRRAGWEVAGVLGDAAVSPVETARREWFDVVGFSLAAEIHLDELQSCIAAVRRASLNPHVGIMVGGPLFTRFPGYVTRVGADGTADSGKDAPTVADQMLADTSSRGQHPAPPT